MAARSLDVGPRSTTETGSPRKKGPPPFVGNRTAAWALQKKTWGRPAMPSAAYFRRQADICLRLSLISSDEEVSNRLIIMAREYAAKADVLATEAEAGPPPRRSGAFAGRRRRRRGVALGAECPRVARRVLARSGLRLPTARKEKPAAFWRGGPEPIDAEAGANRADQPSASVVSSASARCRSRG